MARARNIKPGFFTHEQMAENDPLGRLLFLGLTTLANFNGDLEWRPKRIKVQLLPYDNCDIEKLAINLDKSGFIRFYSDGEKIYLHVVNFEKHQNPHKNEREAGTDIPAYDEKYRQLVDIKTLAIKSEKIAINPDQNGTAPADSLIPLTDSLIPDSIDSAEQQAASTPAPDPVFITIQRNDGTEHEVRESLITELVAIYPGVDVRQEIRSMKGWALSNPKKRKTKSGMNSFINGWLAREQNRGGKHEQQNQFSTGQRGPANPKPDTSAYGQVRAAIERERAQSGFDGMAMASNGVDVRPQMGEQLRCGSGPGQSMGVVLEGSFARAD